MTIELSPVRILAGAIVLLSAWILHGFVPGLLAACVIAMASWPLYRAFASRLPKAVGRTAASLMFLSLISVFVLAPLAFALSALLTELHALVQEIATADSRGMALRHWLQGLPLIGPWLTAQRQHEAGLTGALLAWPQHADPSMLVGWMQSLGQFMARHALIVGFTILLLFFLYRHGEVLALEFRRVLRHAIGERAGRHVDAVTRAVRASVTSMLVVGLFDAGATWIAYALADVPRPAAWAAITGSLAAIPFLGYAAVLALALQLTTIGDQTAALVSLVGGCVVLACGDKVVRPMVASNGVPLRFVWVLMGCLGGFEVLGLVGLVVGPVVLTLGKDLWRECVRAAASDSAMTPAAGSRSGEEARAAGGTPDDGASV
jgi:predicted PurR-regulated permease PerM